MLLFDEADALFGKRSKSRQPRPLRQHRGRLPAATDGSVRGLAILATNIRKPGRCILRRVPFRWPFRSRRRGARRRIWRRTAVRSSTSLDDQAREPSARRRQHPNIALDAAFLAADANEPIRMNHVLRATRTEYAKIEKPLTDAEIGGWQ